MPHVRFAPKADIADQLATSRKPTLASFHCYVRLSWHLGEMYVKIGDEMHYLWRAVDHEIEVLESYATKTATKRRRFSS